LKKQKNTGKKVEKKPSWIGSSFADHLNEELKNPEMACLFIKEAIKYNEPDFLKSALADVVKAHGVTAIAEKSGINRQALYKMLAPTGNPSHKNIVAILDALSLEMVVQPKKKPAKSAKN
jgi:probable addiction module antidote protein